MKQYLLWYCHLCKSRNNMSPWIEIKPVMAGADATEYVWFAVYVPQNPHTFTVASAPTLTVTGFVCGD